MINYTIYVGRKRINRDFSRCINSLFETGKALPTANPKVFLSPLSDGKPAACTESRVPARERVPGPRPLPPTRAREPAALRPSFRRAPTPREAPGTHWDSACSAPTTGESVRTCTREMHQIHTNEINEVPSSGFLFVK